MTIAVSLSLCYDTREIVTQTINGPYLLWGTLLKSASLFQGPRADFTSVSRGGGASRTSVDGDRQLGKEIFRL